MKHFGSLSLTCPYTIQVPAPCPELSTFPLVEQASGTRYGGSATASVALPAAASADDHAPLTPASSSTATGAAGNLSSLERGMANRGHLGYCMPAVAVHKVCLL